MQIYLAPMEGITTYIFRNAFEKYYGGVDKYFTPFLTASHLKGRELRDVHPDNNQVSQVVPQILVNDSKLFLDITRQLAEIGYREVNLNLGCPSGTVTAKGRGAGFLDRTEELKRFLYEIYEGAPRVAAEAGAGSVDISIKTRIGMEFLSEWPDILDIYRKYPISELIIHPRLREEFYSGEIHMDSFIEAFDKIPKETHICYNGDVTDIDSYEERMIFLRALSNDAGYEPAVMIGRGALMNPELIRNLKKYEALSDEEKLRQTGFDTPDKDTFKAFISEIADAYVDEMSQEKQVVMKMKELWSYFAKGLDLSPRQLKEIHKTSRLAEYKSVVQYILS
ncbi:MAG: tRNA-dihydrouridine synthase family protein [Eubacterium sp.]|nr:tRNA-dihydrouridine synthase family protein [Eubacterium sp.]